MRREANAAMTSSTSVGFKSFMIRRLAIAVGCFSLIPSARATWSIIIIDTATREIAVGSATCLTGFDLLAELPLVIVDVGAACAQSRVDFGAINRMRMYDGFRAGLRPEDILKILAEADSSHQQRQYGITAVDGRSTTFTGTQAGAYAGGVVGQSGSIVYAIQGNVLTGAPVINMAERAVLTTEGDLPEKLMAAMEAAYAMGGDGRCSCDSRDPTSCGSPPFPSFDKSAHVGFMVAARTGDSDGVCNGNAGCANGDYFMVLNVPFQALEDRDPVLQLRDLFDAWRTEHLSRPDAVQSSATIDQPEFPADGNGAATLMVTVRDWQGTALVDKTLTVTAEHAPDSDRTTTIGQVIADGGGVFHVDLSGSTKAGLDRFLIRVDDGVRPVIVLPRPELLSIALSDFDADGDVDGENYAAAVACLAGPTLPVPVGCAAADLYTDGHVDLRDLAQVQDEFTGAACVELFIDQISDSLLVRCNQPNIVLQIDVTADPPAALQWFLNGVAIDGATGPQYVIPRATNATFGEYVVRVTNTCRVLTTDPITVEPFFPCP